MINDNTLHILNKIGFGANIDALESYIIDFKQARDVSNIELYSENYKKLYNILKEIKPESKALTSEVNLEVLELDNNDALFEKYNNFIPEIAYGMDDIILNSIENNINTDTDIVAMCDIQGININCVYMFGYVYRIYVVGENNKYIDVTQMLKSKLPYSIQQLSCYRLAELRGKLTISNKYKREQYRYLNIPCSVMHYIRNKFNIDKLDLVFSDLIIDIEECESLPYTNLWDKLDLMEELGVNITKHALVRGITKETFKQALVDFNEYFEDMNDIEFPYRGILIRFNNEPNHCTVDTSIIYNSYDCDSNNIYSSTVKSSSSCYDNNRLNQRLNIVKTKCNDKLYIENIDIDDIYDLELLGITIGSKVKFKVIEGKAVLYK